MKRKFATICLGLALLAGNMGLVTPAAYAAPLTPPASVVADSKADVCSGAALAGASCGDQGKGLNSVVSGVINVLSIAVGVAAVIMLILAGLKYVTSAGDTQGIASAKHTIIYAVVGLIIVAFAQFIVKFVLANAKS